MAIIFITSGSFCHGDDVAGQVADALGYDRMEATLLDTAADRFGVPHERLVQALYGDQPFLSKLTHGREKSIAYVRVVLAQLLLKDNILLHGCMGHLAPRTIAHALHICVIGNFDYRVAQALQSGLGSEKEAEKKIRKDDEALAACVSFLSDKPPFDESLYDIVIPMQETSVSDAVAMISEHAQGDAVAVTDRSRQAAQDFVLSAEVALALAEAGHNMEVHAERGNVVILMSEYVLRQKRYEQQLTEIASQVEGVTNVTVRFGPKYSPPSMNPWANLDTGPKYLLVDDEREFVHTLSERLQTRDLDSAIAYDGEQALDILEKDAPDVMVLDLMMPGIDGIEVLRRVKENSPEVEVIILTGHGSERERELAEELGAFAYLQKPANIDMLARVMKEAYAKAKRQGNKDTS